MNFQSGSDFFMVEPKASRRGNMSAGVLKATLSRGSFLFPLTDERLRSGVENLASSISELIRRRPCAASIDISGVRRLKFRLSMVDKSNTPFCAFLGGVLSLFSVLAGLGLRFSRESSNSALKFEFDASFTTSNCSVPLPGDGGMENVRFFTLVNPLESPAKEF